MNPALVIADCEPQFEHPPGHLELCVPIVQPVPTLDTWALIGLLVIICTIAAIKLVRKPWA